VTPELSGPESGRVIIRRASIDDAAALARAGARLFAQTFGTANRPEDMAAYLAGAFSEARQRSELGDARNTFWLAHDPSGELVGYAHVRRDAPIAANVTRDRTAAEVARLYADSAWHGLGVGASLMRACIESARGWGADVLWLAVWERNPRAIAFYAKQGFHPVGEQDFLLGTDRQHDIVMALDLTTLRS
jgi:GNAT superfamily N-acetyltransferase